MRDPLTWSLPLGHLFGIHIRVHVLFPLVAAGLILRAAFEKEAPAGIWLPAALMVGLLFSSVLLHEFGHCLGARLVDGEAHEILMWPLGGLAAIEVPHTPRANFIATAAGPLVNLLLCLGTGVALTALAIRPPLNPFWYPIRYVANGPIVHPELSTWGGAPADALLNDGLVLLARCFWVNWVLLLLNLLPAFPLDGGRMLQCILWWRTDFRQATMAAIYCGFVTMLVLGIVAFIPDAPTNLLLLCLALFIYATCRNQWILLETGGEESLFGYDFSQGYTSLERDQPLPPPRRRPPNFFKRWLQRRQQRKQQQEQERREAEERRMDELLEKVQRQGLQALTDEERRFLTRVSAHYRKRH